MVKKNLAIIGGGVISGHYLPAIRMSETYSLEALCDINPDCASRKLYDYVPFYSDYTKMLEDKNIDTAVVSTPPAVHFDIVSDLLFKGVNVLIEKPMCANYENIEKIFDLSKQAKKSAICLFHWRYADEVLFLKEYLKGKKIKKIKTHICDDYCVPGTLQIKEKCLRLMGAWYDSGVNALSYIDLLTEIENAKLKFSEDIKDEKSGLPVYVKKLFLCGDTEIEIVVDWRYDTKEKSSVITLDDEELFVSHTLQKVLKGGTELFSSPAENRLKSHYLNMFNDRLLKENNKAITKRIHKVLFEEKTK